MTLRPAIPARRCLGGWVEGWLLAQRRERAVAENYPWATPHLAGALAGDEEAARDRIVAVGDQARGHCVLALHLHDAPSAVMRKALEFVWSKDHTSLQRAAPSRHRLAAMFRHAAFSPPDDLPTCFPVWARCVCGEGRYWRPGSILDPRSTTRLLICHYLAAGCCSTAGAKWHFNREDVSLYTAERSEDEGVSFRVRDTKVDAGGPAEWEEIGADLERERVDQQHLRFAPADPAPLPAASHA